MLVSTLSGVVIDGGMGVVIFIFGGVCAAQTTPAEPMINATQTNLILRMTI
jgi:hypothetical protein